MLHKNKKKQETKVDSYMPCVSNGPHPQVTACRKQFELSTNDVSFIKVRESLLMPSDALAGFSNSFVVL